MPKASTSITTPKKPARANSESPRKQARGKKSTAEEGAEPEVVDESRWRASRVPPGQKINKTAAKQLYRLKDADLNTLKSTSEQKVVPLPAGNQLVTIVWYSEREVERLAWRRHDGPDGFRAYLDKLKATHEKRYGPGKAFPEPIYSMPPGPSVSIVSFPAGSLFEGTPTLQAIKEEFLQKTHGDGWLWKACNLHLWMRDRRLNNTQTAFALRAAVQTLPNYPPRAAPPDPLPPSLAALKVVLDEAPEQGSLRNSQNIRVDDVPFPSEIYYYWDQSYFERVYQALIDVIQAHGVGSHEFKAARWMVYDVYSRWEGIRIEGEDGNYTATDEAYGWLQNRLPKDSKPKLNFSVFIEHDKPPAIFERYNALLPR